jgi:voltage-gated potassium channel
VRRLGILLALLAALILLGTLGYAAIEGTSPAYGFDWTIDTITTLGSLPDPRDAGGRALRVILELLGIGTLTYGLAMVAEFFVSGGLTGLLDRRRTQRMIDEQTDHFIVCGYGRVGRQVVRDLRQAGVAHVVIESNPPALELARAAGLLVVEGPAADDETLERAGIARALGVIACVDSDAENIFITLTAREMRSDLTIVARASAEDSEKKLLRAGANRVVSPYKTSGAEMARVALYPQIGAAVEFADLRIEEIEVPASCEAVGRRIGDVRGLSAIVGYRGAEGAFDTRPSMERIIQAGDMLVAVGAPDTLAELTMAFQPREGSGAWRVIRDA